MRALTWQGNLDVRVTDVPDPRIQEPNDAIIAVTSTAICGSDLHLYGVLGPYLSPGDVLGHEAMGVVTEVGADITSLAVGDRVVIPFNISCGHCWMCGRGLYAQCETTQVRERWIDDLMPMVTDTSDPLGVTGFATHHLPLEQAPHGYDIFRDKADGCLKVVLQP
jgi:threonine dehydrogenase-like Zn-dependent dehydrogenase